ncbi:MAG: proton-conducting transporter membrane subunit [Nitrospira sp.]|nr:proton-conducting transporter membrane subunit [Nitrospira sp.]
MIRQFAPWLLVNLPLMGALLTMAFWSKPGQVKQVAVTVAALTFASAAVLSMVLAAITHNSLLICLLPLAACVSILGQPVEPEHRSAWVFTLIFLNLGLVALLVDGLLNPLSVLLLLVLIIALLYQYHSPLWPMSWWGIASFGLGAAAIAFPLIGGNSSADVAALILSATLLPLVPFHKGYFTALTRLPGNLPSFVVVLLPVLGLHSLVSTLPLISSGTATIIMILALISALYGAFMALAQSRPRSLLAYGSLSFFSIMWWFAASTQVTVPAASVFVGAVALGTSGLLIAWQAIRTRYGDDVDPTALSGLVSAMPRYAVLISLLALAVMGLPPFGVYAGFIGLALTSPLASSIAMFAILLAWLIASWYILEAVQHLLFGRQRTDLRYRDVVPFEYAALVLVIVAILGLGIVPSHWFAPLGSLATMNSSMEWFAWNR